MYTYIILSFLGHSPWSRVSSTARGLSWKCWWNCCQTRWDCDSMGKPQGQGAVLIICVKMFTWERIYAAEKQERKQRNVVRWLVPKIYKKLFLVVPFFSGLKCTHCFICPDCKSPKLFSSAIYLKDVLSKRLYCTMWNICWKNVNPCNTIKNFCSITFTQMVKVKD